MHVSIESVTELFPINAYLQGIGTIQQYEQSLRVHFQVRGSEAPP